MFISDVVRDYPAGLVAALSIVVGTYLYLRLNRRTSKTALSPDRFQPFELSERIEVSHDTRIFRFKLQPDQRLGLPIGQHLSLKADIGGAEIKRAYTPISSDDDRGYFDLMIKVYFANVHPKFPEGGKMSQHLEQLKIGECILVKGPEGRFEYLGKGSFRVKRGRDSFETRSAKHFGMIAGGTGITPMLQIIRAILKDKDDTTKVSLLFANQTEQDILLRHELEECAKDARMKLWYTLDRPEASWKYSKGFVDFEMISAHMPPPHSDAIILMCGPLPMINFACKPNLEKRGFVSEQMFAF
jgi:cytochrome-b5 reductase